VPLFRRGDLSLHYLTRGQGGPLLLIHGLGSSGADWAFQAPALEDRFRLIVPDLPGSGHSTATPGDLSIEGFACDLWALLDSLGSAHPNIVGFSLGGAVALEMALQRPEAVPRLVLINSLASYRIDHWRKWAEARVQSTLVRLIGMRRAARIVARRIFPEPAQRSMRERAADVVGSVRKGPYLASAQALERWCARERLDRLCARTLVIAAEYDYTPLPEKRAYAERIGAEFVVVHGSRHGTPFDSIAATNGHLRRFLTDEVPEVPVPSRRDPPEAVPAAAPVGGLADEHARAARVRAPSA